MLNLEIWEDQVFGRKEAAVTHCGGDSRLMHISVFRQKRRIAGGRILQIISI